MGVWIIDVFGAISDVLLGEGENKIFYFQLIFSFSTSYQCILSLHNKYLGPYFRVRTS